MVALDLTKLKKQVDIPVWQPCTITYTAAHAILTAAAGSCLIDSLRANQYSNKNLWFLQAATVLLQYNSETNGLIQLASPALAGAFGAGAVGVFAPSLGPRGTIAAGASTTSIPLTTALPAAVQINQLKGLRVRIIGNTAGGSGKTEHRTIIANTAGTTPTLLLDSPLTFTPALGSAYEILGGRVYMLGAGTVAAGIWKFFDVATNSYSGNLATANLPASITTDSAMLCLDELYTPSVGPNGTDLDGTIINNEVGGYFGLLTATAATSTTITGHTGVGNTGDSAVLANEYRNMQIRIVEDTTNQTAVGQRRKITSHTVGPNAVYTVPTWTVTPSANAKFYIENTNEILLWTSANTNTYTYDQVANTWSTATYAARPVASGAGLTAWHPFATVLDDAKNRRHSQIFCPRGGNTNIIDMFDLAGGATGVWTGDIAYDNKGLVLFSTGGASTYDPVSNSAILKPLETVNLQPQMYIFDNDQLSLKSYSLFPQAASTAAVGERLAIDTFIDPEDSTKKCSYLYGLASSQSHLWRTPITPYV